MLSGVLQLRTRPKVQGINTLKRHKVRIIYPVRQGSLKYIPVKLIGEYPRARARHSEIVRLVSCFGLEPRSLADIFDEYGEAFPSRDKMYSRSVTFSSVVSYKKAAVSDGFEMPEGTKYRPKIIDRETQHSSVEIQAD